MIMDTFLESLNILKEKYSNPADPKEFIKEFNEAINKYHSNQKNIDSFNNWIGLISKKLGIQIETANSTFFPSFTFFIYHEIIEFSDYKIYKMEYFNISFIEDYFTSQFVTYVREEKEEKTVHYYPAERTLRDSKYEGVFKRIIAEIKLQYPEKKYLDIKFTDYVIGDYQMTYSTQSKTSIFELLFRTKDY